MVVSDVMIISSQTQTDLMLNIGFCAPIWITITSLSRVLMTGVSEALPPSALTSLSIFSAQRNP